MSLDRVPSRSEVMGWSPQQLADYLKRVDLFGCDKVVLKNSINGARFVNMTENDLQKFPKLHTPMISKISCEISKKEEKTRLFRKKPTPKYPEPVETTAECQGWGEDEFEDDFDEDYESPYSGDEEGSGGDYESPNEDQDPSNEYEPPPTERPEDHKLCPTLPVGEGDYIDNRENRGPPPAVSPRPPVSTNLHPRQAGESKRAVSPHCGGQPAGKIAPGPPQIFRDSKPGRASGSSRSPIRGPHRNTVDKINSQSWSPQSHAPDPSSWSKPPVLPPVKRSNSSARPPSSRFDGRREQTQDEAPKHNTFPLHNKSFPPRPEFPGPPPRHGNSLPPSLPSTGSVPHKLHFATTEHRDVGSERQARRPPPPTNSYQDLDPRWYVGKVTRGQAEGCLKRVHKDGAYLVRDSTRQLGSQPFTLMVFYQDKVYNIQIRQQNQQFLLGTGLKVQEFFPSVGEIIAHYSKSPLLLIDAKNRSACQQNQCLLSNPAGYCMSQNKWS